MRLPKLYAPEQYRLTTELFTGYDHNLKINPGSWFDEKNLSAEKFPLFAQRARRGIVKIINQPLGLLAKDALMYIDGSTVYYNDLPVPGIRLSTDPDMLPKQLVSMGAYAVIFPDKVYINTVDLTDCGSLDARYDAGTLPVSLTMCRIDGSEYDLDDAAISPEAPRDPANGDLWIDNSTSPHQLRQYSEAAATWVDILTVYVKISARGINENFAVDDGVEIAGLTAGDADANAQLQDINGNHLIKAVGDDYIVVVGILDEVHTQTGGLIVSRECPDMDYYCESNNRIWGCKYGLVNGETVNEIYACKQGDCKNWSCFAGIDSDSYRVSLGDDGCFTGAVTYGDTPIFFRENCLHRIYGSGPSTYRLTTTQCRGVQEGSWRSLCVVNEVLYYLSRTDVCAYDGSLPMGVSEQFGGERFRHAAAGSDGRRYYINMQADKGDFRRMMVYDTSRRVWHREDDVHAAMFARVRGDLMFVDMNTGNLISTSGAQGTLEDGFEWMAESGLMGYEYADSKYLSRYNIRMHMAEDANVSMYIEYDSSGVWVPMGTYYGSNITSTVNIPVIPRRCDHLRIKLIGRGEVIIYSISRILEQGGDVCRL